MVTSCHSEKPLQCGRRLHERVIAMLTQPQLTVSEVVRGRHCKSGSLCCDLRQNNKVTLLWKGIHDQHSFLSTAQVVNEPKPVHHKARPVTVDIATVLALQCTVVGAVVTKRCLAVHPRHEVPRSLAGRPPHQAGHLQPRVRRLEQALAAQVRLRPEGNPHSTQRLKQLRLELQPCGQQTS